MLELRWLPLVLARYQLSSSISLITSLLSCWPSSTIAPSHPAKTRSQSGVKRDRSHFSPIPESHNLPHSGLTSTYDRTNDSQPAPPIPEGMSMMRFNQMHQLVNHHILNQRSRLSSSTSDRIDRKDAVKSQVCCRLASRHPMLLIYNAHLWCLTVGCS